MQPSEAFMPAARDLPFSPSPTLLLLLLLLLLCAAHV